MTMTVIYTKNQSHFSTDFSSAWAYLHFLPNPVACQESVFSRPVYLQQNNILFSASKSHPTSVDSKNLALNWMEKKFQSGSIWISYCITP